MTYYFNNVYINDKFSLLASTKYKPIVMNNPDKVIDDYYVNEKSIELAESKYQETTIKGLLMKSKKLTKEVNLLINGDLQNQCLASSLASSKFKIPSCTIYSACATFVEGLIIGANIIDNKNKNTIITVSGHNLVSEKQFRFPVEYGTLRKMINTCTLSGSISVLLSNEKSNLKIESGTFGYVTQTNHKDANDMGSAMAPSCAEVIHSHLESTGRNYKYYDLILTGDLGIYGTKIMQMYYKKKYKINLDNVIDSGSIIYTEDNIYAGGSGPLCLPLTLFDYILPLNKYKKILVVGTGSLHSVISSNQKVAMPGVSHAVSLEVL